MMNGTLGEDPISGPNPVLKFQADVQRKIQHYLDKSTPHYGPRWAATGLVFVIYGLRVYFVQGFYIVTYGLGIYILNLLIGFLSPQADPEVEGFSLPSKTSDEFKPFIRRLPEFKFWYSLTKAILIAFTLTFFPMFDVPVFWPILLLYWITLFVLTMKRQIRHMIKYKYVPFSLGKQKYKKTGKRPVGDDSDDVGVKPQSTSKSTLTSKAGTSKD